MKIFVALLISFLVVGCTKHHEEDVSVVELKEIAQEQQIPKALLQNLDDELKEEFKASAPLYSFMPLQVAFKEQQSEVLRRPHLQYNLPKGGGEIDLRDIVTGDGSFFMYFPGEQFDKENELLHVFFVSNSPKEKISTEHYGLGCGKWNDLKPQFKNLQKNDYLKLNTTDLRYLRVVAGTYIFIFKNAKSIFLTQLTLTNSRYTNELCVQSGANES